MEEIRGRRIGIRPALITGVALGIIVLLAILGLFRVRQGEAVVVRGGDGVRLFVPGWHWRVPFLGDVLRVPLDPVQAARDVAVQTREGATLVIHVDGRFAIDPVRAEQWFKAAGWQPFLDGIFVVARESLGAALLEADGGALLSAASARTFTDRVNRDLGAVGARIEALEVRVPQDENPAAAAVARTEAVKLVQATNRRVIMIGWDAADWQLVQPLIDSGRMPNLARLVATGASGSLRPDPPLLSPLIWTTFATGKRVSEHGIADFLVADTATGKQVPISSDYRKVHALWTALSALGRRTDVIAWWASWPAEPILGRMVTERVAYQLFGLETGSANDGKVHPPELWPQVERMIVSADDISYREVKRFIDISETEYTQAWDSLPPERRQEDRINHLRKVLAATRTYHAIALKFLEDPADLSLFYFEGTDTIGHLFAQFLPPKMPNVSEEDVRRFGKAMPEFYVWMDELLGEIVARLGAEDAVMILSDHGFYTGELRPDSDPFDWETGAPQWHRQLGMFVFSGGGVPKNRLGEVAMYDIAPTLLASLGLPVPEDMPGKVVRPALPADMAAKPVSSIASFEALPRSRATGVERSAEADRERMRELAALGYISPGTIDEGATAKTATAGDPARAASREAPLQAPSKAPVAAPSDTSVQATQLSNLAASLLNEGRIEEAKVKLLEALKLAPGLPAAYEGLARIASMQGDHETAFRYLVQGFARNPKMPAASLVTMVEQGRRCNQLDVAVDLLERLRSYRGAESEYHAAWGRAYQSQDKLGEAIAAYKRSLEIDKLDGPANQGLIEVLRMSGNHEEARRILQGALQSAGNSMDALSAYTAIALNAGWTADAEQVLRRMLANDPGHVGILLNLGVCQAHQNKNSEALATFGEVIQRAPNDPAAHYNLGMVLGVEGRAAAALESFKKAEQLGMNTSPLHVAMARAYFLTGNQAATVESLKRALQVEPGDEEARKLLELLRQHGIDAGSTSP